MKKGWWRARMRTEQCVGGRIKQLNELRAQTAVLAGPRKCAEESRTHTSNYWHLLFTEREREKEEREGRKDWQAVCRKGGACACARKRDWRWWNDVCGQSVVTIEKRPFSNICRVQKQPTQRNGAAKQKRGVWKSANGSRISGNESSKIDSRFWRQASAGWHPGVFWAHAQTIIDRSINFLHRIALDKEGKGEQNKLSSFLASFSDKRRIWRW